MEGSYSSTGHHVRNSINPGVQNKMNQKQSNLNQQHVYQVQKAREQKHGPANAYQQTKTSQGRPPPRDQSASGGSQTNVQSAMVLQQRALTQLYQQTSHTPLHATKITQVKSKSHHNQQNSSGSSSKKEQVTRQIDLQAKLTSLLKSKKDSMLRDQYGPKHVTATLLQNINNKADKKGEKRERDMDKAAVARNQLFGETQKVAAKESQQTKHVKDANRAQQTTSPVRHSSALRQAPLTQQILTNQNHQQKPPQSHTSSQPIIMSASSLSKGQNFNSTQPIRHVQETRDNTGRFAHSGTQGARAASNSQTRTNKKKKSHPQNSTGAMRQLAQNAFQEPGSPIANNLNFYTLDPNNRITSANRQSNVAAKLKKKKQQPSQQSSNVDAAEEYLANVARLQYQISALNGLQATQLPNTSSEPVAAMMEHEQASSSQYSRPTEDAFRTSASMPGGEPTGELIQDDNNVVVSAVLSPIHRDSVSAIATSSPVQAFSGGNQTNSKQGGTGFNPTSAQATEESLLNQFKSKCQQEMQDQTKKALAKLLYTKREILLEMKAMQTSLKVGLTSHGQQQQESARSFQANLNNEKEQQSQLTELQMKELIKQHHTRLEASFKAEIEENNERVEERIDDVLQQIQTIVSGLEDSLQVRLGEIEQELGLVTAAIDQAKKDDRANHQLATNAQKLAIQSLESLEKQNVEVNKKYLEKEEFQKQQDSIKRQMELNLESAVANSSIELQSKIQSASSAALDAKIGELQKFLEQSSHQQHQQRLSEQEDKLQNFQNKFSQLIESTLQEAWSDFEQLSNAVKEEVQTYIDKEFANKEQRMETRMEKSKQQFLKAINGNMRVLDNLINDYTTRTHDQIKNQLRSYTPSGNGQASNQLHVSGHEQEMMLEELSSSHTIKSKNMMQHTKRYSCSSQRLAKLDQRQQYNEITTARSLQMVSSVQDVTDNTIRQAPADNDISSQLLSTARDRQLHDQIQQDNQMLDKAKTIGQETKSPKMIIVEEYKFNQQHPQPQDDSSSGFIQQAHQPHGVVTQGADALSQQQEIIVQRIPQNEVESNNQYLEHAKVGAGDQAEKEEEADAVMGLLHEERQRMQGDVRELSIEYVNMHEIQVAQGNVLPIKLTKSMSMTKARSDFQSKASSASASLLTQLVDSNIEKALHHNSGPQSGMIQIGQLMQDGSAQEEEKIDFALSSTSPYQSYHIAPHTNVRASQMSNAGTDIFKNLPFCSANLIQNNQRSNSLKNTSKKGGAFSMRLNDDQDGPGQIYQRTAGTTSLYRPENTDSEFWNLTADDESQMDHIMVMNKLNSTNVLSGNTSVVQIQEADNKTISIQPSVVTNTLRNSVCSQHVESAPASPQIGPHIQDLGARDQTGVQPINYEVGRQHDNDNAHIKEFTPVTSPPLDMQRSFQNSEDDHAISEVDNNVLLSEELTVANKSKGAKREQRSKRDTVAQFASGKPQGLNEGASDDQRTLSDGFGSSDMNDSDQRGVHHASFRRKNKFDNSSRSKGEVTAAAKLQQQPFTKEQARRSAMVPMLEERGAAGSTMQEAHNSRAQRSPLLQKYSRERKTGINLPAHLQRQGNEITQQIYLDEVFEALKDVLGTLRRGAADPRRQIFRSELNNSDTLS